MKFIHVAEVFEVLERMSSRIDMTKTLAQLFKEASAKEANIISNLSLGLLRPSYKGTKFNFAEKNIIAALASFLAVDQKEISERAKTLGDLGSVALAYGWRAQQELTVLQVYDALCAIEQISGTGSQEEKADHVIKLLTLVSPLEAKFIIRIILGILRLGFSDMTLIDALSWMETGDKSLHDRIEYAYNICVDIGLIAQTLKESGIKALDSMQIHVGIPIRPAAAERMPTPRAVFEKLGPCVAQPKLDGFRLQIHLDNAGKQPKIEFFSRNLIDMSAMFPDLVKALETLTVKTLICEGEAISYDPHTGIFLPFQETVKRKRKHGIEQAAAEFPLQCFLFDLLYLNNESYLDKTHEQRRAELAIVVKDLPDKTIQLVPEVKINSVKELEDYFLQCIEQGLEGLVVKKPNAVYQPGKRNFNWIKLKRHAQGELEDTIDCVVLGYYAGTGKRTAFGLGAFLVGVYNKKEDQFETIAKIGTGMTDDEWKELKKNGDKIAVKGQPHNVICAKELYPDLWVNPEIVVMVRADEITLSPLHSAGKTAENLGYALRFPRFMGYRLDKTARETTTVDEVKRLYENQFKK